MRDPVEVVLENLEYDFTQFELTDFIAHIERLNRREIILQALPHTGRVNAMWVRTKTADFILYDGDIHSIYNTHLILHELAHIVLGHSGLSMEAVLSPELLAELPAQGLCRKVGLVCPPGQEEQEKEAEAFVFLVQKRLVAANRLSALLSQSTSIGPLRDWVASMAFNV
jgi:hypothetical protein